MGKLEMNQQPLGIVDIRDGEAPSQHSVEEVLPIKPSLEVIEAEVAVALSILDWPSSCQIEKPSGELEATEVVAWDLRTIGQPMAEHAASWCLVVGGKQYKSGAQIEILATVLAGEINLEEVPAKERELSAREKFGST
ncbi:hypothetical protein ABZP36_007967 [Zizania latifolia]